ncbi:MAG: DUF4926 domain-containing protein [Nostoc sp.]
MKVQHLLFSQVALAQDLPEYNLKQGNVATIVEHYPMLEGEEDGYSLEGFDLPHVTIEVPASQIIPIAQWQQEEMILAKLCSYLERGCCNYKTISIFSCKNKSLSIRVGSNFETFFK